MKTIKITQNREEDKINFYADGCCVATLFDNSDHIVFDELAYGPALLDNDMKPDYIEQQFAAMGLNVVTARYIDSCPTLEYSNSKGKSDIVRDEVLGSLSKGIEMKTNWESKKLYEHPAKHQQGRYGKIALSTAGVYCLIIGGGYMSCPQDWAAGIHAEETQ